MRGSPSADAPVPRGPKEPRGQSAGSGTSLLIFEILLGLFLVLIMYVSPLLLLLAQSSEESSVAEESALTGAGLIFTYLIFQTLQGGFPWLVEFRRGRSLKERLRFTAKLPEDIGIGLALAVICFAGAQLTTWGVGALVGLEDTDSAANTGILEDNEGSLVLVAVIFFVVVGAPLVEELLFRGLILRYLQGWFGSTIAIIGSSLLFTIPHMQSGATWQESAVLLTALGVVGLVLAVGAVLTNRLASSIIAHALFNAAGTIITLA